MFIKVLLCFSHIYRAFWNLFGYSVYARCIYRDSSCERTCANLSSLKLLVHLVHRTIYTSFIPSKFITNWQSPQCNEPPRPSLGRPLGHSRWVIAIEMDRWSARSYKAVSADSLIESWCEVRPLIDYTDGSCYGNSDSYLFMISQLRQHCLSLSLLLIPRDPSQLADHILCEGTAFTQPVSSE